MTNQFEQNIDLFNAYKKGTLESAQRTEFESRLTSDPEFSAAYNDFLMTESFIEELEMKEIQSILDKLDYSESIFSKYGKKFFYAAAILLGISAGLYFIYDSNSTSTLVSDNKSNTTTTTNDANSNNEVDALNENNKKENNTTEKSITTNTQQSTTEQNNTNSIADKDSTLSVVKNSETNNTPTIKDNPITTTNNPSDKTSKSDCFAGIQIETTETCPDKKDGKIILSLLPTNTGELEIKLNTETIRTKNSKYIFDDLAAGTYVFTIEDTKDVCVAKLGSIKVKEKNSNACIKTGKYILNINAGDTWKSNEFNTTTTLVIYDISGNIIFQSTIQENTVLEWQGNTSQSNTVNPGVYLYKITNKENQILEQGNITVAY